MKPITFAVLTCLLLVSGPQYGADQRVSGPPRLDLQAIKSDRPPVGWELHMLRPVYLTEGGMLHGPPDESAFLVPDSSTSRKTSKQILESQHWHFDVPHGYTTWLYCGYGGGGATLKLFKQVAENATECTLSSQSRDGRIKESIEFVCK